MQKTFMKGSIISTMILAAATVAPMAQADEGWYGEISILSTDVDDTSLNSTGRNVTAEFDKDTAFSIAGGYSYEANSLGNIRIEAEYLATDNDTDSVNFNGNNFPANGQTVGGSLETRALFLNVTQEFNTPSDTFTPIWVLVSAMRMWTAASAMARWLTLMTVTAHSPTRFRPGWT
ncbi:outer membrane beta-barrel protein [Aliamphritea spongicola]|nr:outer membrane beta-barrel protein [Aliamphritea spongicola]